MRELTADELALVNGGGSISKEQAGSILAMYGASILAGRPSEPCWADRAA